MKYVLVVLLLTLSVGITSIHAEEVRVLLNPKPKEAVGALVVIFPQTQYVEKGQLTFQYRLLNRTKHDIFAVVDGGDIMGHKLHRSEPYWGSGGSIIPGPIGKEIFRLLYAPELDSQGKPISGWEQSRAETKCNVTIRPSWRNKDLAGYAGGSGELNLRIVFCVDHAENRVVKTLSAPIRIEAKEKKQVISNSIWTLDPWGPMPLDLPAHEAERRSKVQSLIQKLEGDTVKNKQATFFELRDTYVRRRDIPELTQEIERITDPEIKASLVEIVGFIKERWRLPNKGWVGEFDYWKHYSEEFEKLGYFVMAGGIHSDFRYDWTTEGLDFWDVPSGKKNWSRVIDLILTLEPKALKLCDSWPDIGFISVLDDLEELYLECALVRDLTPIKEMTSLRGISLNGTKVTDLQPLKGLSNLEYLDLRNTGATDLRPLKWKQKLQHLYLPNSEMGYSMNEELKEILEELPDKCFINGLQKKTFLEKAKKEKP